MINHLDDRKQWAPLHYAVDANNIFVFKKLTGTEERFQCGKLLLFASLNRSVFFPSDININGGHSENILHIAAQSKNIWNHVSLLLTITKKKNIIVYDLYIETIQQKW